MIFGKKWRNKGPRRSFDVVVVVVVVVVVWSSLPFFWKNICFSFLVCPFSVFPCAVSGVLRGGYTGCRLSA